MPEVDVAVMRMALFVIKPQARFDMLIGFRQLPIQPAQRPSAVVRLQLDFGSSSSAAIRKSSVEISVERSRRPT